VAERRCAEHRITLGTTASGNAPELLGRGYDFLVLGADTTMLRQGGHALVSRARTAATGGGR
jgi:4-hydroxy-2-oxoheptanedioate aldolase